MEGEGYGRCNNVRGVPLTTTDAKRHRHFLMAEIG